MQQNRHTAGARPRRSRRRITARTSNRSSTPSRNLLRRPRVGACRRNSFCGICRRLSRAVTAQVAGIASLTFSAIRIYPWRLRWWPCRGSAEPVICRQRHGDRIVTDNPVSAAGRRHQRPSVAHRDANAVGGCGWAYLPACRNERHGGPRQCRHRIVRASAHGHLHSLPASKLTKRVPGIEHHRALTVGNDARAFCGNRASAYLLDIHVD